MPRGGQSGGGKTHALSAAARHHGPACATRGGNLRAVGGRSPLLPATVRWACTRTTALGILEEEGPPAVLRSWLQRASVALQKINVAALKAAAGAAATWSATESPGVEEAVLNILAEAERLAAAAA